MKKTHCLIHFKPNEMLFSNNVFYFFGGIFFIPAFWENADKDSLRKGNCSSKPFLLSTIISICSKKNAYIVVFKGKNGGPNHALSAFSDENVDTDYSKLTFCEPSGEGFLVGENNYDIKNIIEVTKINRPKLSCSK